MSAHIDGKIYNLAIEAHLSQATTAVKFPCLFFVQWRTNDLKSNTESAKYSPQNQKVSFNETIALKTTAIYDTQRKTFLKKQTQLQLNLISKSRPDQPKLVGRVTIDLATLLNDNPYTSLTQFPLQFCSVNAFIVVSFKIIEKTETDISVYEQQKSIGECLGFASSFRVSTPQFGQEKGRESQSIIKETSSATSKIFEAITNKKQYSNGISSPRSDDQNIFKDSLVKQTKQIVPSTTIKDIRQILEEKSRASSFKTAKNEEQSFTNTKRYVSVISDQGKTSQQTIKLKAEVENLKLENSRKWQEQQRTRLELEKRTKESQFAKLQLRQKQGLVEQANAQMNILRNQNMRLREESSKAKQQSVKLTIKLGQTKDSSSRTSQQLSLAQRELKRYQALNQTLNQTNQSKKEMNSLILNLQKQLKDSQSKMAQISREKLQLQQFLSLKELEYKKKYEDWSQQKTAQSSNKETLLIDLSIAQQKLRSQANLRQEVQKQSKQYQLELQKLTAVSYEFQEAKHSWEITEGLLKDQITTKTNRINELQQAVISTGDRVRWLEGENQLITQNCKQSRQQYLKVKEEKENQNNNFNVQLQKSLASLRQLSEVNSALQKEKNEANMTINSLIQKYELLNKEHEAQVHQNASLFQNYEELSSALNQYQQRCSQFQDLLLSSNEQREKQSLQAAQGQKAQQIRVLQLQNQIRNAQNHLLITEERLTILNQQLENRQDLLSKLEQSLKKQIQRSENLNVRLLGSMERDEKMKDLIAAMEEQKAKITELLLEQDLNDDQNRYLLEEKQRLVLQLTTNLEQSYNYARQLQQTLHIKQADYCRQLEIMNVQITESSSKISQFQQILKNNGNYIIVLQNNLAQNNELLTQKDNNAEKMQQTYESEIHQLVLSKSEIQSRILDLQTEISSLNQTLASKLSQITEKEVRISQISEDLLVKQTENGNLNKKIQELQHTISQLQTKVTDFQNEVLLKQSLIQEQTNRYSELTTQYNSLINEQTTFDIQKYNETLKQKQSTIAALQLKIKQLQAQNNKISSLERSLKIKTIQLNSIKFKGKGEAGEVNELVKLKDEEIASLIAEKERLAIFQIETVKLQEKINALQAEVQLIEEEKFNIESEANEKAFVLEQAREENRKLMEEITIIGEKHSQLEKCLAQLTSQENGQKNGKSQLSLKAENLLKKQIVQIPKRTASKDSNSMNLSQVAAFLRQMLNQRVKNRLLEKLLQAIDKISAKESIKDSTLQTNLQSLSKDFAKLKTLLIKVVQPKNSTQKVKFIAQLKNCETLLNSALNILE